MVLLVKIPNPLHTASSLVSTHLAMSSFPPPSRLDGALAAVVQGALGDSWLVSALNILRSFPESLKKIIVSDRHCNKGKYMRTFVPPAYKTENTRSQIGVDGDKNQE